MRWSRSGKCSTPPSAGSSSTSGPLVVFAAGTGLRPEEWLALSRRDLDREAVTVRRTFSGGDLREYGKTSRSRRRVPLRQRVLKGPRRLASKARHAAVVPALRGGYIQLHNFRAREWKPAIRAAGIEPARRLYDLRHTYATFSLAAGVSLFTLSRRMGTSVEMIDRTYGHLAPDAEDYERGLLDAFDKNNTAEAAGCRPL
jgi:integrase